MPSDPTVAVVASLLFHGNIVYQFGTPKTHLDALERIIAMRGGTESFSAESTYLVQKICRWVIFLMQSLSQTKTCVHRGDIDYSIHQGGLPRFFRDHFPYNFIPVQLRDNLTTEEQSLQSKHSLSNLGCQLKAVHEDLKGFCQYLNDISESKRLNPTDFEDALISMAYRLLYLYPLGTKRPESQLENAYQLGAIAIVWTLLFESGRLHRTPYNLLAAKMQDSADMLVTTETGTNLLQLWLLFVSGISVMGSNEKEWLHCRIKRCTSALNLEDWPSTRELLGTFPWITLIHDKPARKLWHAAAV